VWSMQGQPDPGRLSPLAEALTAVA
jgi:hypothetical protein